MVRIVRADHVAAVSAQLGECPIWDAARLELCFVDIVPGTLSRLTDNDRAGVVYELGATLAAALPVTDGSRPLVTQAGFRSITHLGQSSVVLASCAFGGPAGGVLYITTATGLPAEKLAPPLAGELFPVCPDVTGPAASPWRPVQPSVAA